MIFLYDKEDNIFLFLHTDLSSFFQIERIFIMCKSHLYRQKYHFVGRLRPSGPPLPTRPMPFLYSFLFDHSLRITVTFRQNLLIELENTRFKI